MLRVARELDRKPALGLTRCGEALSAERRRFLVQDERK